MTRKSLAGAELLFQKAQARHKSTLRKGKKGKKRCFSSRFLQSTPESTGHSKPPSGTKLPTQHCECHASTSNCSLCRTLERWKGSLGLSNSEIGIALTHSQTDQLRVYCGVERVRGDVTVMGTSTSCSSLPAEGVLGWWLRWWVAGMVGGWGRLGI